MNTSTEIESSNQAVEARCQTCAQVLCLRQQTISLALGHDESMFCLSCLAKESGSTPLEVLNNIKGYVMSRQCFRKEWVKYPARESCPQPLSCLPDACFAP